LVDEDFPRRVARALAHDPRAWQVVITVDERQITRAAAMGGVLISHTRTDRARFRQYVAAQRARRPAGESAAAASVLLLPVDASETRLLLRTTLVLEWYLTRPLPKAPKLLWDDAQQALIGGWQPAGYAADQVRIALGRSPAP
jgi:hypothetical protein